MSWIIFTAALALTALLLVCIWVASDADDYREDRKNDE